MKGIRQRGKKWMVDVTINGVRRTATCASYEEAVSRRAELLRELKEGSKDGATVAAREGAPKTLGEAWNLTWQTRWKGTRNEAHLKGYGEAILERFGGDTPLESIRRSHIEDWVVHLRSRGQTPKTVARKLSPLRVVLQEAADREWIEDIPKFPKLGKGAGNEEQGRVRFLSLDEERAMLQEMRGNGDEEAAQAVEVLVVTGLRRSELLRLEGRDLGPRGSTVTVWKTKNGRSRTLPIQGTRAQTILLARRQERGLGVLWDISGIDLWRAWDKARQGLGIEDKEFVIHALRHTCATRLARCGWDLKKLQAWLGHEKISMTARYSHLIPGDLDQGAHLMAQWDAALESGDEDTVIDMALGRHRNGVDQKVMGS